jgi:AcrR family transcriptional regulator
MNAPDPHAATRARIADAAERLFRTMGYQKTAVADIARECGMSPANVYRFFPSKSAINEAITQRLLGGLAAMVDEIAAGPGSAEERLRATMVEMHRRDIALFFAEKRLHDMVTAAMTEHWGVIERFIEHVLGVWAGLLREGIERGEFAGRDPEATALTLKHLTMLWTHPVLIADCLGRGMEPEELERNQRVALDLVMAGLKTESY